MSQKVEYGLLNARKQVCVCIVTLPVCVCVCMFEDDRWVCLSVCLSVCLLPGESKRIAGK